MGRCFTCRHAELLGYQVPVGFVLKYAGIGLEVI